MARIEDPIDRLRGELDTLVARMQTPAAKAGGAALFGESVHEPEAPEQISTRPGR